MSAGLFHRAGDPKKVPWALYLVLAALLVVMAGLSKDFGITIDEAAQTWRGDLLFKYYFSGGRGNEITHVFLYGSFWDLICVAAQRVFYFVPKHEVRHFANSLLGWAGILYTVLLGRRLFGVRGAFLCLVLFCVSPRYLAHSMNNSKDIPFATFAIAFLYHLFQARPSYPYFSKKQFLVLCLLFGVAFNLRQAAVFLLLYAFLYVGLLARQEGLSLARYARIALFVGGGMVLSFMVAAAFWPGLLNLNGRVTHLPAWLTRQSTPIHVLFEGDWEQASYVVPYFFLVSWAITLPLAVTLPAVLSPLWLRRALDRPILVVLLTAAFLPLLAMSLAPIPRYDEVRHFLFAYPPLVLLATGAWCGLWQAVEPKPRRVALAGVLLLGLALHPLLFEVRNHPNQVVYFNPLVGGVKGAFKRYELDYWANCYKQSMQWLDEHTQGEPGPIYVTFGLAPHIGEEYTYEYPRFRYTSNWAASAYWVRLVKGSQGIIDDILAGRTAPGIEPARTVHTVEADGVPLCVVQVPKKRSLPSMVGE